MQGGRSKSLGVAAAGLALSVGLAPAWAQEAQDPGRYRQPPAPLAQLLDAPNPPQLLFERQNRWVLRLNLPATERLEDVAAPKALLAGLQLWPEAFSSAKPGRYDRVELSAFPAWRFRPIQGLPVGSRWDEPSWSPDGKRAVIVERSPKGCWLWEIDPVQARARRLSPRRLNATVGMPYRWLPNGELLLRLVPAGLGAAPKPPAVPSAAIVFEADGSRQPSRTDPTLLKNGHDEALFAHLLQAQVAILGASGRLRELGRAGLFLGLQPSPNGAYLLVEEAKRPFSRQVSLGRFATKAELWRLPQGQLLKAVDEHPHWEAVSTDFDAVEPGKRGLGWLAHADATLTWIEALDGGDPKQAAPGDKRDALYVWAAPFLGEPRQRFAVEGRIEDLASTSQGQLFVQEGWWKARRDRRWVLPAAGEAQPAKPWIERSSEDRYADPGELVTTLDARGRKVIQSNELGEVFTWGDGATPEGDRPFLKRWRPSTGEVTELFRSPPGVFEDPWRVLDARGERFLTRLEAGDRPHTYGLRRQGQGGFEPLERPVHPQAALQGLRKELLRYRRADGLPLSGTLYLPPGWSPAQGRLPLLMWAYPNEYKSASAAGQVQGSPHRFTLVRGASPLHFVARGYAVLDNPSLPILGEGDQEPNDTYVAQLRAGAEAAVKAVVEAGVADPARIAVGGHSYGAFMTANLLAHTRLFAAGIARSGAYNRTLTPFGFQSEERSYWQAPGIYAAMSPFHHANLIESPLLFIHGQADTNPGTFPIQSERMFQAMKGLGKRARLVMLPHEDHGYRARESLLHVLAETDAWLERWVKAPPDRRR